jgi:proline iminopeptidase
MGGLSFQRRGRRHTMSEILSQEGYISVTGGRVWYRVVGTGSSIPLLTLHGGPGANSGYLEPLTALADERPVILYDQLGGGQSDHPDNPALWVLDRFVEELTQVCATLRLRQFHLFGQSWGTMLAVEYALNQPAGLVSLLLSGPVLSVPRYVQDANALKRELPIEMQEAIERHESAGTTDSPEYQAAFGEWMRRHVCRNEAILDNILKAFGDPATGINGQVYNTMQGPSEFSITGNLKDFDRTTRLHEIKVPTLFTCGRYDECTPSATAWYHSLMPGSEMVVFEQSAHMTHLEEPERYDQTTRDFLHKVESRALAS